MPRKRSKKGEKAVTVNVRVSPEAHELLKTYADMVDSTMSEALVKLIRRYEPAAATEVRLRKERKQLLDSNQSDDAQNDASDQD